MEAPALRRDGGGGSGRFVLSPEESKPEHRLSEAQTRQRVLSPVQSALGDPAGLRWPRASELHMGLRPAAPRPPPPRAACLSRAGLNASGSSPPPLCLSCPIPSLFGNPVVFLSRADPESDRFSSPALPPARSQPAPCSLCRLRSLPPCSCENHMAAVLRSLPGLPPGPQRSHRGHRAPHALPCPLSALIFQHWRPC